MTSTPLAARLAEERRFHDVQAQERWAELGREPARRLRVDAAHYLGHEPWIAPAFRLLGDVTGLPVLDYGCGHGMAGTLLAQRGARVSAFDLSAGYVREANARAAANGVGDRFAALQAAGERLPFAAGAFARVWGHAILHHLELESALPELRRVLAPDGRAVFCEPWGGNPALEWARATLPYPGKHRSRDERPLQAADLKALRAHFAEVTVYPFQLLGMAKRLAPRLGAWPAVDRFDRLLFQRAPATRTWCRYVVVVLKG